MSTTRTTGQDVDLVVLREKGGKQPARGTKAEDADLHPQASKEDKRRSTRPSR